MNEATEFLERPASERMRVIADWEEARITDALGREFRTRSAQRISVRKPGWMPSRLFRWLMRTVVVEERPR